MEVAVVEEEIDGKLVVERHCAAAERYEGCVALDMEGHADYGKEKAVGAACGRDEEAWGGAGRGDCEAAGEAESARRVSGAWPLEAAQACCLRAALLAAGGQAVAGGVPGLPLSGGLSP